MPRISYYFSTLITCLYLAAPLFAQTRITPSPKAYLVTGRCHDYGTALGLKAHVYATVNGVQKELGECREVGKFEPMTGTFDVRVPATATQLQLVMPGYRTVTIPIQFEPDIPDHARFTIGSWSEMTALDSLPKPTGKDGNLALFFDLIDSLDVDAELKNPQNPQWLTSFTFFYKRPFSTSLTLPLPAPSGTYVLALSTRTGQPISTDTLRITDKLLFKSVRVVRPTNDRVAHTTSLSAAAPQSQATAPSVSPPNPVSLVRPVITPPSSTTLYFDQSSHELRARTRHTLDSIAQVLTSNPALFVTLTGYSDNVGPQAPNLILSEYRTRTVASYLQQRRVAARRITTNWVGPAPGASSVDADSVRSKSRRVEIQVN